MHAVELDKAPQALFRPIHLPEVIANCKSGGLGPTYLSYSCECFIILYLYACTW